MRKGLEVIGKAIEQLEKEYELLVLEGAGSPVEMNLKDRELVNMKVAEMADVPVILAADIDRGGVFASLVGTLELMTMEERRRVKGIIINKFRGDSSLFKDGVEWIEDKTGVPVVGVFPYIHNHMIDPEDSLSDDEFRNKDNRDIVDAEGFKGNRYDSLAAKMGAHLDWDRIKRMIWDWENLKS